MSELLATLVPVLGYALVHFLWQGAVIGLLAALGLHSLRGARPQARYALACVALLACLLVPLGTVIAQLAVMPATPFDTGAAVTLTDVLATAHIPGQLSGAAASASPLDAFLPWVVVCWAVGTIGLTLRMGFGLLWISRACRGPTDAAQPAWQDRLDVLALRFGLRRGVRLYLVDSIDSPVSAGWWRPVVLLPAGLLTRMPTDLIEALLAHELAHVRRHDYLVNLVQHAIEALLFYHPVTWWLSNRIRTERELIADQIAAEVACAPRRLALALSELSDFQSRRDAPVLALAARGGHLLTRVEQLVRPSRDLHAGARILVPMLILMVAGAASYAIARVGPAGGETERARTRVLDTIHTVSASEPETIALVRAGDIEVLTWGLEPDPSAIDAARRGANGDFLWVYGAGREHVFTDPVLIGRALEATRQADGLRLQSEALSRRMEAYRARMDAVGERIDRLSSAQQPTSEIAAATRVIRDIEKRQRSVEREDLRLEKLQNTTQLDAAGHERIAEALTALSVERDELNRVYMKQLDAEDKRTQEQFRRMQELVDEAHLAQQRIDALDRRIEVMSDLQERTAEQAGRDVRRLVSDAMARSHPSRPRSQGPPHAL